MRFLAHDALQKQDSCARYYQITALLYLYIDLYIILQYHCENIAYMRPFVRVCRSVRAVTAARFQFYETGS